MAVHTDDTEAVHIAAFADPNKRGDRLQQKGAAAAAAGSHQTSRKAEAAEAVRQAVGGHSKDGRGQTQKEKKTFAPKFRIRGKTASRAAANSGSANQAGGAQAGLAQDHTQTGSDSVMQLAPARRRRKQTQGSKPRKAERTKSPGKQGRERRKPAASKRHRASCTAGAANQDDLGTDPEAIEVPKPKRRGRGQGKVARKGSHRGRSKQKTADRPRTRSKARDREKLRRAPTFELASKTVHKINKGRRTILKRVQELKEGRVTRRVVQK
jgi:hypothetical protein